MAKSTSQERSQQILDAVRAHRPGREVVLFVDESGNEHKVHVNEVPLKHIRQFSAEMGLILPDLVNAIGDVDITPEQIDEDPDIVRRILDRPQTIGKVIPLIFGRLANLINLCVDPENVFLELPHDMAAPVVRAWIDINLLAEGKIQSWTTAFSGLGADLSTLLPSDKPSSPSSAKDSTSTGSSTEG